MEKLFKDIILLKKFILRRYKLEKIESRLQPEICGLELKLNLAASLLNCLYSRKVKRFRINPGYFVSVISFQLFNLSYFVFTISPSIVSSEYQTRISRRSEHLQKASCTET